MSEIETEIRKLLDKYVDYHSEMNPTRKVLMPPPNHTSEKIEIVTQLLTFDKKTVENILCDDIKYSSFGPEISGLSNKGFSCVNRTASTTTMNSDSSRPSSTGSTVSTGSDVSSLGFSDETDLSQFGSPRSDYSDSVDSLDGSVSDGSASDASTGSTASVGSASDGSLGSTTSDGSLGSTTSDGSNGSTTSLGSIDTLHGKPLTKLTLDDFKTMYEPGNSESIKNANNKIMKLIKALETTSSYNQNQKDGFSILLNSLSVQAYVPATKENNMKEKIRDAKNKYNILRTKQKEILATLNKGGRRTIKRNSKGGRKKLSKRTKKQTKKSKRSKRSTKKR